MPENNGIVRRQTKVVYKGQVAIGGDAPVSVQSMCNTDTRDLGATVAQIKELEAVGCQLVRVAVPDQAAVANLAAIKAQITVPLIADIHFKHQLALGAIAAGADCIRINPGNIGGQERLKEVIGAAQAAGVSIRLGINAGSLEQDLRQKYGRPTPEALVESAQRYIGFCEEQGFTELVISLKSSDVLDTIAAYQLLGPTCDYPFHIGITEAGTLFGGTVRSAVGLGGLLLQGLGDTMRVSLTADPVQEVRVAWNILKSLRLVHRGVDFISCPTCGRTRFGLIKIAGQIEERLAHIEVPLKVAVMGCAVNGPGEAREADIGLAGGGGKGVIFRDGKPYLRVEEADMVEVFVREVERLADEKKEA